MDNEKESSFDHIVRRARERYGLNITVADVIHLQDLIRRAREVLGDRIGREHAYNGAWRSGESNGDGGVYGEKWRIRIWGKELRAVWLVANGGRLVTLYHPADGPQGPVIRMGQVARITKLKKKP